MRSSPSVRQSSLSFLSRFFPSLFRRLQHTVDIFVACSHFSLLRSLLSLFSSFCKNLFYLFYFFFPVMDTVVSSTENRGKRNSAKGTEEQKPVMTVALDRVCVRV